MDGADLLAFHARYSFKTGMATHAADVLDQSEIDALLAAVDSSARWRRRTTRSRSSACTGEIWRTWKSGRTTSNGPSVSKDQMRALQTLHEAARRELRRHPALRLPADDR